MLGRWRQSVCCDKSLRLEMLAVRSTRLQTFREWNNSLVVDRIHVLGLKTPRCLGNLSGLVVEVQVFVQLDIGVQIL